MVQACNVNQLTYLMHCFKGKPNVILNAILAFLLMASIFCYILESDQRTYQGQQIKNTWSKKQFWFVRHDNYAQTL